MTEKMAQTTKYPFCALVGQEMMKEAIVLNMIDPGLGGVLIRGQKGTAKTTAVRGIPDLMPDMKVVEIPANATEDRVAGSIDIEAALKDGEKRLEAGLLWEADGNVLYVDEINLLDDHLVDLLLDAAATGLNTVEFPVCLDWVDESGRRKSAPTAFGPVWNGCGCEGRRRGGTTGTDHQKQAGV